MITRPMNFNRPTQTLANCTSPVLVGAIVRRAAAKAVAKRPLVHLIIWTNRQGGERE
jgi:hypothetical protein